MEVIASKTNEKIRLVRALQEQRKARERERLFVVEGARMVEEAALVGARVRLILHEGRLGPRERSAVNRLASAGAAVAEVAPEILRVCSDTAAPQGLLAVVEQPDLAPPAPLRFALVADGITNPGNLGSLLRAAEAFGVELVLLAPGCVDAFNPKVVRGAMGAHFHVPILEAAWAAIADRVKGMNVYLAAADGELTYTATNWTQPSALIVGSEASGASKEAMQLATKRVSIPMPGRAESLNAAVAASIIIFESVRQAAARPDGRST